MCRLNFVRPMKLNFNKLDAALIALAKTEATRFGLELKIEYLGKHSPSLMNEKVQRAYAEACDDLGLTHTSLTSGAGHDGQSLADLCPVGMIFVPSVNGTSHSPQRIHKMGGLRQRRECFVAGGVEVGCDEVKALPREHDLTFFVPSFTGSWKIV